MASHPGAIVGLTPAYSPWSEYEKGLSFEDWLVRIFKLRDESDSLVQAMKGLLADPEKMKQDDEVVVSLGGRRGGTNARLKPKSAINASAVTTAKPSSQLARLAIRRSWLHAPVPPLSEDLVFTKPDSIASESVGCHGDPPMAWPETLVVPLMDPLEYGESSRDDPERPEISAVRRAVKCDEESRKLVHGLCRKRCAKMVAAQQAAYHGSHPAKRSRNTGFQSKTTCEALLRLVDASFVPAELEANASPSTKFVIGKEPVQPTFSDEIVKARCSCVDGSTFPEWLATNCRGWITAPLHPESAEARRNVWRHGHLHFALSAPRASYARWRMKVAPKSVQPEDGLEPKSRSLVSCCHGWATPFRPKP